jgi:hypothetical protein
MKVGFGSKSTTIFFFFSFLVVHSDDFSKILILTASTGTFSTTFTYLHNVRIPCLVIEPLVPDSDEDRARVPGRGRSESCYKFSGRHISRWEADMIMMIGFPESPAYLRLTPADLFFSLTLIPLKAREWWKFNIQLNHHGRRVHTYR